MAVQRPLRFLLTVLLVGGGPTVTSGGVAVAECMGYDPWPSFKAAVPSAKMVFVGSVVGEPTGYGSVFRLRVDEALRGNPPVEMEFRGFKSGVPLSICNDSTLRARRTGDRLAFAIDALLPGTPDRIDAVAFVGDSKPNRWHNPKMERLPLTKVRRLAGHAADGSTVRRPTGRRTEGPLGRASVKKVKPGVWRVTDDWTGSDMDRIRSIAAGPDDDMWLAGAQRLSRLGAQGAIKKPERVHKVYDLDVAPDGRLLVSGLGLAAYDKDSFSWTKFWSEPRRKPGGFQSVRLMTADGTFWAASSGAASRWGNDGWRDFAHGCYCTTTAMAETSDGTVWMGVAGTGGPVGFSGTGLFRLEGDQRGPVQPFGERTEVHSMAAGPGGELWVSLLPEDAQERGTPANGAAHLARWDGSSWAAYEWPSWLQRRLKSLHWNAGVDGFSQAGFGNDMEVTPDGTLWFKNPLMSFDGETWRSYQAPHSKDNRRPHVEDFTIADDGTVWLVVRDRTAGRPSQPDGIYVIDPAVAVPRGTEKSVQVIDPGAAEAVSMVPSLPSPTLPPSSPA